MFSHGVDPELDFSNMPEVVEVYEKCTRPQGASETAVRRTAGVRSILRFASGRYRQGHASWRREKELDKWTVPYLPIDPQDVGREYEADVIRINSQSGKGGVAYILEQNFGYAVPPQMREEIGYMVKDISDREHKELSPVEVYRAFAKEYVNVFDPDRYHGCYIREGFGLQIQ